jgi:hypothetical protein
MNIVIQNIDSDDIITNIKYTSHIPSIGECMELYVDDKFELFRIANVVHIYSISNIIDFIRIYVYIDR